ncbi:hypothetical protein MLD38_012181 [Melastoma candidum]|uniref:Uncharacterized protein n=1 Tax=Melastoma candidum TaxID=119954 RepID=A0ACB9R5J5_9MYRT|nr:hypothetical protein MLD38_012181 [Melastoma candidum]
MPTASSSASSFPSAFRSQPHFLRANRFFPSLRPFASRPKSESRVASSSSPADATAVVLSPDVALGEDWPEDYDDWLPEADPKDRRRAGVLLHPTSLRGAYGIGDLGEEALHFIDWLHSCGSSLWQVLPLVPPTSKGIIGGSPYSGEDANCGNTLLISLEELVKDGLLMKDELPAAVDVDRVDFAAVAGLKRPLIAKAAKRLIQSSGDLKSELEYFLRDPDVLSWLEDAAYFAAIDHKLDTLSWYDWPDPLKNRHPVAMEDIRHSEKEFIDTFMAEQFLFQKQWQKVHDYALQKGISIMGDMAIYVDYHSADVWAYKDQFLLNKNGSPILVSGVPPDAFSGTGQLWNSPLYNWTAMEKDGFLWWIRRLKRAQSLFDEFRIDHFRGFSGFWAVPAGAKVATFGRWKVGPRKSLFDAIFEALGDIHIIAEDLGVITKDVVQLRKSISAPGMAVLHFAFGDGAESPHLPHNHERNQVVYTGTHDNDTTRGWWDSMKDDEKSNACLYLSLKADEDDISWILIRTALSSVAKTAIIPMQDILGLDSSARMNLPSTVSVDNWSWRIPSSISFDGLETEAVKFKEMLSIYGRS